MHPFSTRNCHGATSRALLCFLLCLAMMELSQKQSLCTRVFGCSCSVPCQPTTPTHIPPQNMTPHIGSRQIRYIEELYSIKQHLHLASILLMCVHSTYFRTSIVNHHQSFSQDIVLSCLPRSCITRSRSVSIPSSTSFAPCLHVRQVENLFQGSRRLLHRLADPYEKLRASGHNWSSALSSEST